MKSYKIDDLPPAQKEKIEDIRGIFLGELRNIKIQMEKIDLISRLEILKLVTNSDEELSTIAINYIMTTLLKIATFPLMMVVNINMQFTNENKDESISSVLSNINKLIKNDNNDEK